jgi:hypothetical protein
LYGEIKDQETKFRKVLEICGKWLEINKFSIHDGEE